MVGGRTWEWCSALAGRAPTSGWLAVACLLLAIQIVSPLWYATPDTCGYLSIARSLADSFHPTNLGSERLLLGAGYPILISPIFLVGAYPFLLLSVIHAILAILYSAGTYTWVKRYAPDAAVPIAVLAVGHVAVLWLFRRALSEAAFMPLLIWLANALAALRVRFSWSVLTAAAVLLAVAATIRQAGILVIAGFGLQLAVLVWRRQIPWFSACWQGLAVALPAVLAVTAMVLYDQAASAREGTWSHLDVVMRSPAPSPDVELPGTALVEQCTEGLRLRVSEVGRLTIPGMWKCYARRGEWLNPIMLVYVPLCVVFLFGWLRFARTLDALALTFPFYAALYIYWPFDQSGRFFTPLVPLFFLCFWYSLEALAERRRLLFQAFAFAHVAIALGFWLGIDLPSARADDACWPAVRALARAIGAAPEAVEVGPNLGNTDLMMQYVLDRPVRRCDSPTANSCWLIVSRTALVPVDFASCTAIGPYRLLRAIPARTPPESSASPVASAPEVPETRSQ